MKTGCRHIVGLAAAILFVQLMTNAGFSDVGGPVDVIVLILIGLSGGIGLTILTDITQALISGAPDQ